MQISTRTKDFVVDTIALVDQIGDHLRPVFANPSKLKILHGANQDVKWLKFTFGIKIINMFDTYQAAKQLWPKP